MDNENSKINQPDEEYHFGQGEPPEATNVYSSDAGGTATASSNASVFERVKRKNVLIAAGIIVVVLSVYKILDVMFSATTAPKVTHTKAVTPPAFTAPVVTATPAPVETTPATVTTTTVQTRTPETTPVNNATNDRINDLEQKDNALHDELTTVTNQLSDMQATATMVNRQLGTLNDAVQNLSNQIAQMQAAAQAVEAAKHKVIVARRYAPQPIYFVRAMIPGRAWLMTKSGETLTVSLGDTVPGYGVIQVIDPNRGIIVLSSGAIIGYSPGDS